MPFLSLLKGTKMPALYKLIIITINTYCIQKVTCEINTIYDHRLNLFNFEYVYFEYVLEIISFSKNLE